MSNDEPARGRPSARDVINIGETEGETVRDTIDVGETKLRRDETGGELEGSD